MANIDNNTTNLENILSNIDNIADPVNGTLSITTNGTHDVSIYANANVNVQSAPVLLWTNPSPSSTVESLTVTINGTGYNGYIVAYRQYTSSTNICGYQYLPIGATGHCSNAVSYGDKGYRVCRKITSVTTSSISFDYATYGDSYGSSNWIYYVIPYQIWGVKWTL